MFHFKTYTAVTLIGLLAACGGGGAGTSGGGGSPSTIFTYQALVSTVPGTSTIVAAGLTQSDPSGLADGTDLVSGTLDRASRALTINGIVVSGVFETTSGSWTDGTATVSPSKLAIFANTNTYDFFVPVTVAQGDFESQYILGVVSRTQDLPTEPGSQQTEITYSGVARVESILGRDGTAAGTAIGSDGRLSLTADFANGLVDVVIDQLVNADMPFDTVRIDDLVVDTGSDATFARNGTGFITFANGEEAFSPSLGTSTSESASGAFFGGAVNEIVAPVEAGGVFTVNGENGNTIFGIFAAD